jgi:glc operon protein GlcG
MRTQILTLLCVGTFVLLGNELRAQQPAPPNLDAIPEQMTFNIPYGAPIGAERANSLIQAAAAEATKKGWPLNIAVVDSGANLVAFLRMDGALLGSIAIAQHKARTAANKE